MAPAAIVSWQSVIFSLSPCLCCRTTPILLWATLLLLHACDGLCSAKCCSDGGFGRVAKSRQPLGPPRDPSTMSSVQRLPALAHPPSPPPQQPRPHMSQFHLLRQLPPAPVHLHSFSWQLSCLRRRVLLLPPIAAHRHRSLSLQSMPRRCPLVHLQSCARIEITMAARINCLLDRNIRSAAVQRQRPAKAL